jgi:hypothetical protein
MYFWPADDPTRTGVITHKTADIVNMNKGDVYNPGMGFAMVLWDATNCGQWMLFKDVNKLEWLEFDVKTYAWRRI